jgi:hypothetical protein
VNKYVVGIAPNEEPKPSSVFFGFYKEKGGSIDDCRTFGRFFVQVMDQIPFKKSCKGNYFALLSCDVVPKMTLLEEVEQVTLFILHLLMLKFALHHVVKSATSNTIRYFFDAFLKQRSGQETVLFDYFSCHFAPIVKKIGIEKPKKGIYLACIKANGNKYNGVC